MQEKQPQPQKEVSQNATRINNQQLARAQTQLQAQAAMIQSLQTRLTKEYQNETSISSSHKPNTKSAVESSLQKQLQVKEKTSRYRPSAIVRSQSVRSSNSVRSTSGDVSELISSDSDTEVSSYSSPQKSRRQRSYRKPLRSPTRYNMTSITSDTDESVAGYTSGLTMSAETISPQQAWMECLDEASGNVYYFCEATGESRWDDPSLEYDQHKKWE